MWKAWDEQFNCCGKNLAFNFLIILLLFRGQMRELQKDGLAIALKKLYKSKRESARFKFKL